MPVITAAISPYRETPRRGPRADGRPLHRGLRQGLGRGCAERDPKGLYKKAFAGEIKEFTGVSDPYEEPLDPEIVLDTEAESPEESAAKLIALLEERQLIPAAQPA